MAPEPVLLDDGDLLTGGGGHYVLEARAEEARDRDPALEHVDGAVKARRVLRRDDVDLLRPHAGAQLALRGGAVHVRDGQLDARRRLEDAAAAHLAVDQVRG